LAYQIEALRRSATGETVAGTASRRLRRYG
jgi:hypothetical protein